MRTADTSCVTEQTWKQKTKKMHVMRSIQWVCHTCQRSRAPGEVDRRKWRRKAVQTGRGGGLRVGLCVRVCVLVCVVKGRMGGQFGHETGESRNFVGGAALCAFVPADIPPRVALHSLVERDKVAAHTAREPPPGIRHRSSTSRYVHSNTHTHAYTASSFIAAPQTPASRGLSRSWR